MAPIDRVRRLPEKATRAEAIGREAYVSTSPCFGKGKGSAFEDFMTAKARVSGAKAVRWNCPLP
jgi:hypothetical protein